MKTLLSQTDLNVIAHTTKQDLFEVQLSAARGNTDSMLTLAKLLLAQTDLIVHPSTHQAHSLLSKAALLNNLEAKMFLALIYENGCIGHDGVEIAKDKETAIHLFAQLSEYDGYELCIEKLADSYLDPESNSAAWMSAESAEYAEEMAYLYYEKAALKGLASAQFKQAMMHKEGKGTPKNIGLAQYMLHHAVKQGYAPAIAEYEQNRNDYI